MVGVIIAFLFMGKRIRRLGKERGALTYPELLGKMFGSKFLSYAFGLIFVAAMPLYTVAVLIGGARLIETTLGIPYMTALLGFAGVGGCCAVCGYRRSDCGDVYGCGAGCDYAYGDGYSAGSDVCVSAALLRRTVLLRR